MARRRTRFTSEVIAQIENMLKQGASAVEISKHVGCSIGCLRARCSQLKIRLQNSGTSRSILLQNEVRLHADSTKSTDRLIQLTIVLRQDTAERLRDRAAALGTTESELAARLMKAIAYDDLYEAVLSD